MEAVYLSKLASFWGFLGGLWGITIFYDGLD
jgi:hypothetical protein